MDRFYERRDKFPDIPELRLQPTEALSSLNNPSEETNIQVYYRTPGQPDINPTSSAFDRFKCAADDLGYSMFLPQYFAYSIASLVEKGIIDNSELELPSSNKHIAHTCYLQLSSRLDGEFSLEMEDGEPYLQLQREAGRISLIDEYRSNTALQGIAETISSHQLVIQYANERSRTMQERGKAVLSVITRSPLDRNSLTIDASDSLPQNTNSRSYNDARVAIGEFTAQNIRPLLGTYEGKIKRKNDALAESGLSVANTLDAKNMPHHPIFHSLKKRLEPHISSIDNGTPFDPMDLLYQVSFRLTCHRLSEIFSNYRGGYIEPDAETLAQMTTLEDYNLVRQFTNTDWDAYDMDPDLIDGLAQEQLALAEERYAVTATDVDEILGGNEVINKHDWYLVNQDDRIFCINDENNGTYEVEFKEMDTDVANDYHATYHYIHAPRAKRSFGLFMKGAENPFTIAGIDEVDRDYKKDALLLLGYDYENCVDFTRLYSLPDAPKMASSLISRLIKRQLLEEQPNTQAAISTFMPTYANSNSMFACGFDKPFLLKRNLHKFVARPDIAEGAFEHVTNRRAGDTEVMNSKQVLLPVVELLSEIKKPRFKPTININKQLLVK